MSVSVFDVAKYILDKSGAQTAMKLQKLVYYCQAWSLAWDGKPLFTEKIEAWSNGPVVRELFKYFQGQYLVETLKKGNKTSLNSSQKKTIDSVIKFYGDKSPQWLSDLTHMENPWKQARAGLSDGSGSNREISLASMEEYYTSLRP